MPDSDKDDFKWVKEYGLAVGVTLLALFARVLLDPYLGDHLPYVTFYVSVAVTAWYGGLGPSLIAVLLGAVLSNWFFMPPRHAFSLVGVKEQVGLLTYFMVALAFVGLEQALRRARQRAEGAMQDAQRELIERTRVEQALRETEARYRATFANAAVGIAHVGLDGRWLRVNDCACAITGYSREELLARTFADITYPDDIEASWANARRLIAGEISPFTMEKRYVRKNGDVMWVDLTVSLLRGADGTPQDFITVIQDITERKRAEEALRESELRFSRVVGQTSVGVVQANPVGRMTLVNPSWCRMLGYSEAELLQMNIADITHPTSLSATQETVRRLVEGGPDFQIEKNYRRKDGSILVAGSSVSALRRPDGDYLGLIAVVLDVGDRKRGEALLAEQQQLLERIATGCPLDDCLKALTDAVSRLQPNTRAAVLMANADQSATTDCHSAHMQPTFGASITGAPINDLAIFTGEPVTCSDIAGSEYWSQPWRELCLTHDIRACHSTPVFGPEGKAVASFFLCFAEAREPDAWERRIAEFGAHIASIAIERDRVEKALRESEQETKRARDYAEATLRTSPVPLLILEKDFRVNTVNEAFYQTFQVNPAETQGRLVYELGNGQWNIPKLRELLETILPQRTVFKGFEVTHDFESIGRRTMLLNVRRIENEPDMPERSVLVIEDITDLKRAEEALGRLNDELEQRVAERTYELVQSEDRLRALATEINLAEQRERKRLATELHDHLQQILVLGRIKLKLGQGKRPAKAAPAAAKLMKETDELLSEALAYTRTLVSDLSPTVLRDHGLAAALQWLGAYMQKFNQIVAVIVPDDGDLKLPEDQVLLLFQSVRELLINSSKHAGTGEATVALEQRDGLLRIDVRDEGAGFDLAAAAAAAAAAGTPSGGISSKFGLFSIRERMRALRGSFDLQSAPGKGTTATLTLPLGKPSVAECLMLNDECSIERKEIPTRGGESAHSTFNIKHSTFQQHTNRVRVLLVDDHIMVRQGLRSVLDAYADIELVGEAGNGEEAVQLVDRLRPAIVVMDINMPKMNGIEATVHIKQRHPETIVIGLSVNASDENQEAMKRAGAAMLLTKETVMEELYGAIQAAGKK